MKCKYCSKGAIYITNHQASDNDYSRSFIVGDTFVVKSYKEQVCTAEINVDIKFCPFCGEKIKP